MNLLPRTLLTNAFSKHTCVCNFVRNEIRSCYGQYHTLNTPNKPESLKCNEIVKRDVSLLSDVKFAYMDYTSKLRNFLRYRFDYIPVFGVPKLRRIGYLWYDTMKDVNVNEFFTLLKIEDNFFSRFKIMELHVWMLLYVLPQKGKKHSHIRYSLIMAMWEDHRARAKIITESPFVVKEMKTLYEKFKMSLLLYDLGYQENDISLANAVWYNFFSKENVDPRYIEALVGFIRHQIHHLNSLNIEKLENEEVKTGIWLSIKPHVDEIFQKA